MTQKLVAHIGLGGVQWLGMVTNVLRRVEHAESKSVQKVSRGEQPVDKMRGETEKNNKTHLSCISPHDGSQSPSSGSLKKLGNRFKLRNGICIMSISRNTLNHTTTNTWAVSAFGLQQGKHKSMLLARILWIESLELGVNHTPSVEFLLRVLNGRDQHASAELFRILNDCSATLAVLLVLETRMISIQLWGGEECVGERSTKKQKNAPAPNESTLLANVSRSCILRGNQGISCVLACRSTAGCAGSAVALSCSKSEQYASNNVLLPPPVPHLLECLLRFPLHGSIRELHIHKDAILAQHARGLRFNVRHVEPFGLQHRERRT